MTTVAYLVVSYGNGSPNLQFFPGAICRFDKHPRSVAALDDDDYYVVLLWADVH